MTIAKSIAMTAIGRASTPFARREDAPHQPVAAPDVEGALEIAEEFRAGLADLASFDRIWVLFQFDRSEGWAAKIKPPRGGPKRGVFATRAPHRPSPIGMTCVRLLSVDVETGILKVRGIDLLDGTPVLDLKPYIRSIDSHPDANQGWLDTFLEAGIEPALKKPPR